MNKPLRFNLCAWMATMALACPAHAQLPGAEIIRLDASFDALVAPGTFVYTPTALVDDCSENDPLQVSTRFPPEVLNEMTGRETMLFGRGPNWMPRNVWFTPAVASVVPVEPEPVSTTEMMRLLSKVPSLLVT